MDDPKARAELASWLDYTAPRCKDNQELADRLLNSSVWFVRPSDGITRRECSVCGAHVRW